jgi:single-stranded DNA-binding protein
LVNNEYTDKDGNKKSRYELRVTEIQFLSAGNKNATPESEGVLVTASDDADLPF